MTDVEVGGRKQSTYQMNSSNQWFPASSACYFPTYWYHHFPQIIMCTHPSIYFISKETVTNQKLTTYDLIPILACPLVSMPTHTSLQLYSLVHSKVQYTVCCDAFLPELKLSPVCTLLLVHTWPESLTFNLNKLWLPNWQLVIFPLPQLFLKGTHHRWT